VSSVSQEESRAFQGKGITTSEIRERKGKQRKIESWRMGEGIPKNTKGRLGSPAEMRHLEQHVVGQIQGCCCWGKYPAWLIPEDLIVVPHV
jgi:hypothetical protein